MHRAGQHIATPRIDLLIWIIAIVQLTGAVGLLTPFNHLFVAATPVNLTVLFALTCYLLVRTSVRFWKALAAVYLIGLGVEIVGVQTGWPFGSYTYGEPMGVKLLGAPITIGMTWVMVSFGMRFWVNRVLKKRWQQIILAVIAMVAFDFVMEPVAIAFDFWHWMDGHPPVENYVGWAFVSACVQTFLPYSSDSIPRKVGYVFLTLAWFFHLTSILDLAHIIDPRGSLLLMVLLCISK